MRILKKEKFIYYLNFPFLKNVTTYTYSWSKPHYDKSWYVLFLRGGSNQFRDLVIMSITRVLLSIVIIIRLLEKLIC